MMILEPEMMVAIEHQAQNRDGKDQYLSGDFCFLILVVLS